MSNKELRIVSAAELRMLFGHWKDGRTDRRTAQRRAINSPVCQMDKRSGIERRQEERRDATAN